MTVRGVRRRHREGAQITDVHATCHTAPASDYSFDIYYDEAGGGAGTVVGTVTIPAGELYGFAALDGQTLVPFESEVWPVAEDDLPPDGWCVVVGGDRPRA